MQCIYFEHWKHVVRKMLAILSRPLGVRKPMVGWTVHGMVKICVETKHSNWRVKVHTKLQNTKENVMFQSFGLYILSYVTVLTVQNWTIYQSI